VDSDVVVVGAGPAGSAAAYFLARAGVDVLLLDRAGFPRDKTCGDGLTASAAAVIREMGVLDDLLAAGRRVDRIELVAPGGRRVSTPLSGDDGLFALAVPRLLLDDRLRGRAVEAGARFEGRAHVTAVEADGRGVRLTGEGEGRTLSISARMAVVATGASIGLLRQAGLLPRAPEFAIAARTYVEGPLPGGQLQVRFDGVPLPGYGWIFPVSDDLMNVGAGAYPLPPGASASGVLRGFMASPGVAGALAGGRQVGGVRSYPLRVDFARSPTFGPRLLLVGEAAGLVNPLTGEGIHYALQSGRLAGARVLEMFERGDFSPAQHEVYDRQLRDRFQEVYETCALFRRVFMRRRTLDLLARVAGRRQGLGPRLVELAMEDRAPSHPRTAPGRVRSWLLG
jgi:menaquinone-9 beta-reductase